MLRCRMGVRSQRFLAASLLVLGACTGADAAPTTTFIGGQRPAARQVPDLAFTDDDGHVVVVRDGEVVWRFRGILGMDRSSGVEEWYGQILGNDLDERIGSRRYGPTEGLLSVEIGRAHV